MNLIVLEPHEAADGGGRVSLTGTRAAHLITVLGVSPGQQVRVGLLDGPFGIGTVISVDNGSVTVECRFESGTPERPAVDLLLALPRPKVMRRLWAQLAALGVGRIILTNAERVERNYFDTHVLTEACYRPLLIEGLQQARDTRLPLVSIHRQFRKLVEDDLDILSSAKLRLVADPETVRLKPDTTIDWGHTVGWKDGVVVSGFSRTLVAVGPEGGWNDFERELLRSRGFVGVALGPRTLRTDTACVALLAVIHQALNR